MVFLEGEEEEKAEVMAEDTEKGEEVGEDTGTTEKEEREGLQEGNRGLREDEKEQQV